MLPAEGHGGAASPPTALHTAVHRGDAREVARLLKAAAGGRNDVASVMVGGQTPLHTAVRLGAAGHDIVGALLACSADITAQDAFGNNALHYAASEQSGVLELILARTPPGKALLDAAGARNTAGCTPLARAVQAGSIPAVQMLLRTRPGCVGEADARGATALHHAAELTPFDDATQRGGVSVEIAELLLGCGGGLQVGALTHNRDTALHYAAAKGSVALVNLLVHSAGGEGVDAPNADKRTPLDLATLSSASAASSNEQLRFAGFPGHSANRHAVIAALLAAPRRGAGGTPAQSQGKPRHAGGREHVGARINPRPVCKPQK